MKNKILSCMMVMSIATFSFGMEGVVSDNGGNEKYLEQLEKGVTFYEVTLERPFRVQWNSLDKKFVVNEIEEEKDDYTIINRVLKTSAALQVELLKLEKNFPREGERYIFLQKNTEKPNFIWSSCRIYFKKRISFSVILSYS